MREVWRDVIGYEGYYEVSCTGVVRSIDRHYINSRGQNRFIKGRVLKTSSDKDGYRYVILVNGDDTRLTGKIHRIVAEAFLGKNYKKKHVNHIDGCKINNCVDNLEWVTNTENRRHAAKLGLMKKGNDHPMSKITDDIAATIKSMLTDNVRSSTISTLLSVSEHIVYDIKRNKTWRHIPWH